VDSLSWYVRVSSRIMQKNIGKRFLSHFPFRITFFYQNGRISGVILLLNAPLMKVKDAMKFELIYCSA